MRPHLRRFLVLAVLLTGALASAAGPRVVAVGDVHGDYDAVVAILQKAGLIDSGSHWIGGNAVLVQTGDLLDRGPRSRDVLDLFMALEAEAPRSGGRVVVLLGNHEVMNLMADLRYVPLQEFAQFVSPRSEKLRQSAYSDYLHWRQSRKKAGAELPPELSREAWMERHPAGYFEHRQLFAANGKYGRWLRKRPALFVLTGTAFVHAGFGPEVASQPLEAVDRKIHEEIAAFDRDSRLLAEAKITVPSPTWEELFTSLDSEIRRRVATSEKSSDPTAAALAELSQFSRWLSVSPEGPLWYRGYDHLSDAEGSQLLATFLKTHSLQHVVAGHTPQSKHEIRSRFAGGVFQIDTGMLSSFYPGGQPSALEISDGHFTAIYQDHRVVLLPAPGKETSFAGVRADEWRFGGGSAASDPSPPAHFLTYTFVGPDKKPLPFKDDEEILEFLKTANIVETRNTSTGTTDTKRVTLEKDGVRAHAVFRTIDLEKPVGGAGALTDPMFRDSYIMEPPAYELSKYLGIPYVPPAVLRTIHNEKGSLQLWIENAMDEEKRKKTGAVSPDPSRWNHFIHTMHVWDNLVCNSDRNMGNVLIDPLWNVWYINHTRAFWRHHDLINQNQIQKVERHLWERIQAMNEAEVRPKLSPFLRKDEIDALFKRRQTLINYVQKLIRQKGEKNVLYTYIPPVIEMLPAK